MTGQNLVVRANLFGGLEMLVNGQRLTDDISRSKNLWNLLAYVLTHRDRPIPLEELIDVLWADEDCSNPSSALKTLMYRTRVLLEPFTGETQLISSQRGAYSWNPDVECSTDFEDFERLFAESEETTNEDEKVEKLRAAVRLYKGEFLPRFAGAVWVVPIAARCHGKYVSAVRELCELLIARRQYDEAAEVGARAVENDPYDEQLHALYIRSLMAQGKDNAALAHYEKATDLLYRELGIRPGEELRRAYGEIMQMDNGLETDLGVIQQSLKETADRPGAFVCDFGFFKEIYRLEVRRSRRSGTCVHIALITVTTAEGETPTLSILNRAMDNLLELLTGNLRRGDVVSRYSPSQYVLMLPTANFEDGTLVMERIVDSYFKQHRRSFLSIHYKLRQIELYD